MLGYRPFELCAEGGDHAGKNETTLGVAQELAGRGWDVVLTNAPQYWSPVGATVRHMNRKGSYASLFLEANTDKLESTKLRCAMYALDRLLTLPMVLESCNEDTIIVSDRGPDSNTVTLGYRVFTNEVNYDQACELQDDFLPRLEHTLLGCVSHHPYLCVNHYPGGHRLESQSNELQGRNHISFADFEALDDHEKVGSERAQEIALNLYKRHNFPEIITGTEDGWRYIPEVVNEILKSYELPELSADKLSLGNVALIGPSIFLKSLGLDPSYLNQGVLSRWEHLMKTPFVPGKKVILDELDEEFAAQIAEVWNEADLSIYKRHPGVIAGIKEMFIDHPGLMDLLKIEIGSNGLHFIENILVLEPEP